MKFKLIVLVTSLVLSTPVFAQPANNTADEKTVAAFREDLATKVKVAGKKYDSVIQGKDGWMFFAPEVRSVSVGKFWGEDAAKVGQAVDTKFADPLPAILDFKAQLDKLGIQLLLVPVPPKAIIYADKISGAATLLPDRRVPERFDSAHQEFYKLLREKGVNVLDLTDIFMSQREMEMYSSTTEKLIGYDPIYCKQDTHWSPRVLDCGLSHQENYWDFIVQANKKVFFTNKISNYQRRFMGRFAR